MNETILKNKLFIILDKKYCSLIYEEFKKTFNRPINEGVSNNSAQKWETLLESMKIKFTPDWITDGISVKMSEGFVCVKDPSRHGFVYIPRELAEKILVLGDLP